MSIESASAGDQTAPARDLPRVALVGPVSPPFRGGIARYTSDLRRSLASRCELHTVSFRRLYPGWLYPGASDREPGMEGALEPGVRYTLDALDPRSWSCAASEIADAGCDLAIINWWTLFWAPGFAWMARRLRKRGVPVAFLCHNLFDHDSGMLKRRISRVFLSQADAFLTHSNEHAARLHSLFPGKSVHMHPLPTDGTYPTPAHVLPRRGRLELLFFGFIRPYKGLEVLLDALALLADRDVYLTVGGEPWCAPEEIEQRVRASGAPNVELHLQYVDAVAAADFFARADLVVLPYRAASGSAVAAMAFHYDKPVLATRVGGFPDAIDEGCTGFLVEPDSAKQLADRIRALDRASLTTLAANVRACKSRFTWSSLADTLIGAARSNPRHT